MCFSRILNPWEEKAKIHGSGKGRNQEYSNLLGKLLTYATPDHFNYESIIAKHFLSFSILEWYDTWKTTIRPSEVFKKVQRSFVP